MGDRQRRDYRFDRVERARRRWERADPGEKAELEAVWRRTAERTLARWARGHRVVHTAAGASLTGAGRAHWLTVGGEAVAPGPRVRSLRLEPPLSETAALVAWRDLDAWLARERARVRFHHLTLDRALRGARGTRGPPRWRLVAAAALARWARQQELPFVPVEGGTVTVEAGARIHRVSVGLEADAPGFTVISREVDRASGFDSSTIPWAGLDDWLEATLGAPLRVWVNEEVDAETWWGRGGFTLWVELLEDRHPASRSADRVPAHVVARWLGRARRIPGWWVPGAPAHAPHPIRISASDPPTAPGERAPPTERGGPGPEP